VRKATSNRNLGVFLPGKRFVGPLREESGPPTCGKVSARHIKARLNPTEREWQNKIRGMDLTTNYTKDLTTAHASNWAHWLKRFAGLPHIRGIEVGCFEGRSSVWFLENILAAETSTLICIDPRCRPEFSENIRAYQHKVLWIKASSRVALREPTFRMDSIHFAYIDGDHSAPNVLEDAVLLFPLLVAGGILIFDDYQWRSRTPDVEQSMPRLAIDAFLSVYQNQVKLIHRQYQVCLEKE